MNEQIVCLICVCVCVFGCCCYWHKDTYKSNKTKWNKSHTHIEWVDEFRFQFWKCFFFISCLCILFVFFVGYIIMTIPKNNLNECLFFICFFCVVGINTLWNNEWMNEMCSCVNNMNGHLVDVVFVYLLVQ